MDPLFNVDYSLNYGSPAIDAGMDTSSSTYGSVIDDIMGILRGQDGDDNGPVSGDGSDYDIGAYEMPEVQPFVKQNPQKVVQPLRTRTTRTLVLSN